MNKPKNPKFYAKADKKDKTLYLYGNVMEEEATDWLTGEKIEAITPKGVRALVEELNLNPQDTLKIHLNSYGGSVFAAVAIYNYLKELQNEKEIIIDGVAASGASVIAMAGDKIYMGKGALLMVHQASTFCFGNACELEKVVQTLKKIDNSIIDIYMSHFNGTKEQLMEMLENETWLDSKEAKEKGFCHQEVSEKTEKVTEPEIEHAKNLIHAFARLAI